MASLQHIKKRLIGIRNINQMTKAMELVAATKMRRSQETALASRPYAFTALEILANVVEYLQTRIDADGAYAQTDANGNQNTFNLREIDLLRSNESGKTAILLVSSDKGLAGSFNSSVFRKLEKFLANYQLPIADYEFIPVGQKAIDYVKRQGYPLLKEFSHYGDFMHLEEVLPLSEFIIETYLKNKNSRLLVFSTHFFSALKQDVMERQLLPIDFARIRATVEEIVPETGRYSALRRELIESRPERPIDYLIEPSPEAALNHLLPLLFKMEVYHLILEANASEHSARRLAMKNASDNASDIISRLVLEYNRSRQAAITKEIIEITSTTAAIKK
jgi:F-type H+-transporting ATPase subunit gamma